MNAWISALLAAMVMSWSAAAASSQGAGKNWQTTDYPVAKVSFAGGVVGYPNLVYSQPLGHVPLTLDLYLPPKDSSTGLHPLIVHIHGGSWMVGDSRTLSRDGTGPSMLASLAARGYVVASINYRMMAEGSYIETAQDVFAAIRWLRHNAKSYGIDPAKVGTFGGSAGGHLAMLTSTGCEVPAFDPTQPLGEGRFDPYGVPTRENNLAYLSRTSSCVQAAVSWFGVSDFTTLRDGPRRAPTAPAALHDWLKCEDVACVEGQKRGSPVTYVSRKSAPMLLIHGTEDGLVPVQQSIELAQKLTENGVPVESLIIPNVDHGFEGKDEQTTVKANEQAWNATVAYLLKVLPPK